MIKSLKIVVIGLLISSYAIGGNPDRAGGAGATQLLVNPYAMSAGFGGVNTASVHGIEAFQFNAAGLAYTENFEIAFSSVSYLTGTNTNIYNVSGAYQFGNTGNVIAASLTYWDLGSISQTTEASPEGIGTFLPQFMNFGLGYAKKFSNSITSGVVVRYITEGIANVMAQGVCLDAGVQYQTALNPRNKIKKEDFRFGIGVRNIGPNMAFSGTGLSVPGTLSNGASRSVSLGSDSYNLPALVNIGAAYDIRLDAKNSDTYYHRLSPTANFNYMAFTSNIVGFGVEYAFKESIMIRTAYNWQQNIATANAYMSQYYGISGGFSIVLPISKTGNKLGIDYAYNPTRVFNGIHNVGIRYLLGSKKS